MEPNNVEVSGVNVSEKSQAQEFKEAMHRKQQAIAIERLKEMKVIEIDQVGNVILDTSIFSSKTREVNIENRGQDQKRPIVEVFELANRRLYNDPEFGDGKFDKSLFYIFKDVPVVDIKEYEEAKLNGTEVKPRSLFYIPQDKEAALNIHDPDANRNNYYLLFSDVYKNGGIYPTKEAEFESGVTSLDVALLDLVYRKFQGQRNTDGVLMVDIDGDGIASDRLSVTTINSQLSLKKESSSKFQERLPQKAPNLYERGLFKEDDIDTINYPTKEEVGNVIGQHGYVTIDGIRLYLGKEKEVVGSRIQNLGQGKYVAYKQDGDGFHAIMEFRSDLIPGREQFTNIDTDEEGNITVRAMEGSFYKRKYDDKNKIAYARYSQEGKTITRVSEKELIESLLEGRSRLAENGIDPQIMASFSIESQGIIQAEINRISQSGKDPYLFLKQLGRNGLQIMEKECISGGIDSQTLDWGSQLPTPEKQQVVNEYLKLHNSIDKFEKSLQRRLGSLAETGVNQSLSIVSKNFIAKTSEAMRYKAGVFLFAAATSSEQLAQEQLQLLSGCLSAFSSTVEGNGKFAAVTENQPEINYASDGTKSFAVWVLKSNDGEQLSFTIRPEEKINPSSNLGRTKPDQARISMKYKNKNNQSLSLRIDRDPTYGIALDIGSKDDPIVQIAQMYGETHHTQVTYEKAFNNPKVFARTAKTISLALGYDFDEVV